MIRFGKLFRLAALLAVLALASVARAEQNAPSFQEVFDLIRTNADVSNAALNRAAVEGLLNQLGSKAVLVTNETPTVEKQRVTRTFVFDDEVAYLRVRSVGAGLAEQLRSAYQQLAATNHLKGAVVDLRFADGADYSEAVNAAQLFRIQKSPELNWGAGPTQVKSEKAELTVPIIVLVNGQTAGAAEALAALLRDADACLLLGNPTAGRAMVTKDFPLSDGEILRLATKPVKLNGDDIALLRPDITVNVKPVEEKAFYNGDFLVLPRVSEGFNTSSNSAAGTNVVSRRPRLNEAELVRAHKQGLRPDEIADMAELEGFSAPAVPVIADPALSRGVDLLKGLAIVRQSRR